MLYIFVINMCQKSGNLSIAILICMEILFVLKFIHKSLCLQEKVDTIYTF